MEIVEYLDEDGANPFRKWFDGLDAQAAARVTRILARMGDGNLADTKPVGIGVLENRLDFGPGYRLYFGRDGDTLIILLAGGTKRRQQTDIRAAQARWDDYKRRRKEVVRDGNDQQLSGDRQGPRGARARLPRRPSGRGRR